MADGRPPRMEQPISLTARPLHHLPAQHWDGGRAVKPAELLLGSCPASQGASDVLAPATWSGAHRGAQRSPHTLPKETEWEQVLQHTGAQHSWHWVCAHR